MVSYAGSLAGLTENMMKFSRAVSRVKYSVAGKASNLISLLTSCFISQLHGVLDSLDVSGTIFWI
jgi:hypothetical protein